MPLYEQVFTLKLIEKPTGVVDQDGVILTHPVEKEGCVLVSAFMGQINLLVSVPKTEWEKVPTKPDKNGSPFGNGIVSFEDDPVMVRQLNVKTCETTYRNADIIDAHITPLLRGEDGKLHRIATVA